MTPFQKTLGGLAILFVLVVLAAELPAQAASQSDPATASPALKPRSETNRDEAVKRPGAPASVTTIVGSLALVLGVFFLVVWALRRTSPGGSAALPPEAFEILGRATLANRQQATLLRCGNKLVLVAVGATDTRPLVEIADAAEVERLTSLCRHSRPAGALHQVFGQKEAGDG